MFSGRLIIVAVVTTATIATVMLSVAAPGCGPAASEADKAAEYTAESLAQELAFRYRSLKPEAKKFTRAPKAKSTKSIAQLETDEKLDTKGKDVATTKKRSGPPSLDDILDDFDVKLGRLKETSPSAACQQVIETISKDNSLTENDKKLLTEKLKERFEGS
jgi:hypothetical protein